MWHLDLAHSVVRARAICEYQHGIHAISVPLEEATVTESRGTALASYYQHHVRWPTRIGRGHWQAAAAVRLRPGARGPMRALGLQQGTEPPMGTGDVDGP
jgi:hypothetical protein